MKRIVITGRGKISVKPDRIRLIMTMSEVRKNYADALKDSDERTGQLKEIFEALGFDEKALKTLSFSIDTEYEGYHDKDGNWKQRFKGYRFNHELKIEFDVDNALLVKVLTALSASPAKPEFRIQYTVKDMEACRNMLLEKAVADSAAKAKVLTKAAGVSLGEIHSMDYSWNTVDIYNEPVRMAKCNVTAECCDSAAGFTAEPDDISVEDSVTVIWKLK